MKKNKISKNWINKQRRDIYVRKSKVDGYRSRAVYKLIEIDKKFNILKNGISLVDLGAAPGSWSQYASQHIKNCKILSIDIKDMENIDKVHQIKGDFTQKNYQQLIKNYFKLKIDVVLSDMAENTTGNKNVDSISIGELCKEAMYFAKEILKVFKNRSYVFHAEVEFWSLSNQDDEVRKRSQELYEKIINLFELVIIKGIREKEFIHVDSRMTAIYILSVFQGINWFCIFNDKKLKAENYIRDSIEMIILGLCKT